MNVACLGLFFASLALGLAACGGGDDDAGPFGPQGSSDTDTEDSKDDSPGNSFSGGDEDCAFRVKLTGGFDAAIDWRVGCSGFGGEGAMELGFTDAEAEGGAVFLISVSGIEEGETGTGFPATVSILGSTDDDTPLFHSTEEGDCSIDITSHEKREGALGAALYVAKAASPALSRPQHSMAGGLFKSAKLNSRRRSAGLVSRLGRADDSITLAQPSGSTAQPSLPLPNRRARNKSP